MSKKRTISASLSKADRVFSASQLRDESMRTEIAKERAKFDAKTAKLRALRLAKEAEDKIAADKAALEAPPKKAVKKRAAKAAPVAAAKKAEAEPAEDADEAAEAEE